MKAVKKNGMLKTIAALAAAAVLAASPVYAEGWVNDSNGYFYILDNGSALVNTMTPDGYYVDENGIWRQEELSILGQRVTSPQKYIPMSSQSFGNYLNTINALNTQIQNAAPGRRRIHVYRDGMSLCAVEKEQETPILILTEDTATGGYRLRISTNLGSGGFVATDLRTYDYEVFRYMCSIISNRPSVLADAIYQSWQGENHYGINMVGWAGAADTMVMVEVENGAGIYRIAPR